MNSLRISAAACLIATLLSLWPLTGRRFVVIALTMVGLCAATLGARFRDAWKIPAGISKEHRWIPKLIMGFIAYFLIRTSVELFLDDTLQSGMMGAQSISGMNVALTVLLALLFFAPHAISKSSLTVFYISVGLYSAINLVADNYIFLDRDIVFGESRFEVSDFRWLPPLARSNAFFSMTCVVVMGGIVVHFTSSIRRNVDGKFVSALLIVAFAFCAYAAFKTQFRANLLIVAATLGWIIAQKTIVRKWMAYSLFALMFAFPFSFALGVGHEILQIMTPARVLDAIGSKTGEVDTLSERTLIYEYAGQRLSKPMVVVAGEGPVYRDAQDGLGVYKPGGYRMPYHAASFDLLLGHGVFIGGMALLGLFFLMKHGFQCLQQMTDKRTPESEVLNAALVNMTLWISTSIMDSGISNLETFCFATLPLIGAIALVGRGASPVISQYRGVESKSVS